MRETIKVVNGYEITRIKGTKGYYTVYITPNKFIPFRTIKAASAYCETLS